jgi:hypothetical protein
MDQRAAGFVTALMASISCWTSVSSSAKASSAEFRAPFLVRSGLKMQGPVTASLQLKASKGGTAAIAWRTSTQKDFLPACKESFQLAATDDWQTRTVKLPVQGQLIHLRILAGSGIDLAKQPTNGIPMAETRRFSIAVLGLLRRKNGRSITTTNFRICRWSAIS